MEGFVVSAVGGSVRRGRRWGLGTRGQSLERGRRVAVAMAVDGSTPIQVARRWAAAGAVLAAVSLADGHVAMADEFTRLEIRQALEKARIETNTATQKQMDPEKSASKVIRWRYSYFIGAVEDGEIAKVTFSADGSRLLARAVDGNLYILDEVPDDPSLLTTLRAYKVDVTVLPTTAPGSRSQSVASLLPFIVPTVVLGLILLASRRGTRTEARLNNPLGRDMSRPPGKLMMTPNTGVTFSDVAGCDGAKEELEEVVNFLREPLVFAEVGAKLPRGVLLEGPPGTGKTLLARAVAGEAGVPFFSASGPEFVEMFVGVGASRVRELFTQAKQNAPCIIFVDEIDSVGRQRGAGFAMGNDEREQTLNQILVELDGFEANNGVIVLAATNRADSLDSALLRPGRFNRRVLVDLPDFAGRCAIIRVHMRGKPIADGVDVEIVARRTPGFSGAEIENMLNEAAIYAARREKEVVSMDEIDDAIERTTLGLERRSQYMSPELRELIAYHEAGHAVVGAMMPGYDQVAKLSIVPRGRTGGVTLFVPSEERQESGLYSKQFLEDQLSVALGGRLAEELVFGPSAVTNGAVDDLERVSRIARQMVTRFGFSDAVGQQSLDDSSGEPSMSTLQLVDEEVERLVRTAYGRARTALLGNRELLDGVAERLLDQETIGAVDFERMVLAARPGDGAVA